MNPSPDPAHDARREQLGAYALGQLDPGERADVDTHLSGCAACRAELAAIAPLVGPLGHVDPDEPPAAGSPPSPAGFAAILGRVREEQALDADTTRTGPVPVPRTEVVPLRPRSRPLGGSRLLVAAAAVVIALAGLGVGFGLGAGAGEPTPEPVTVQALDPAVQASAGTIAHTWGVEMTLTATGFDPGAAYDVAVVGRDGRRVEAGAFLGTGATEMRCRLNASVLRDQASGFVVTDASGAEVLRSQFA